MYRVHDIDKKKETKMIIIIKQNGMDGQGDDIIEFDPKKHTAQGIIRQWGKNQMNIIGRIPGHTWKIAESDNLIDAMIESNKLWANN